jgi:hypothetical protein
MRIEVRQAVYRMGDSINIRVTLRNTSGDELTYAGLPASDLAQLVIHDPAGIKIKQNILSRSGAIGLLSTLGPGAEITLRSEAGSEWINLRDWGYDVRAPGHYLIEGIPRVAGPRLKADYKVRSNKAMFNIKRN